MTNSVGRVRTPCAPLSGARPACRGLPALPARMHLIYLPAISRTTRKRALPLIIRSYASAAFSNGKISFIECTSADALNSSVPCESMDVPDYHEHTIQREPAHYCRHRLSVCHGRDHNSRTAKLIQFRRRIGGLAVDVV